MRAGLWLAFIAVTNLAGCAMSGGPVRAGERATRITVIPSMHRFHREHPTYDFNRLYRCVSDAAPDLVGVELRPEDIAADDPYLSQSYPPEMIALRNAYRQQVFGFDWLGDEIAGRPIPANWWRELSTVKKLERAMAEDPAMTSKEDDDLSAAQSALLKDVSPAGLADGRYDRLVRQRRAILRRQAGQGVYSPVVSFTDERERRIGDAIAEAIRRNRGKSLVLIMGADHHGFAVERIRSEFGPSVQLTAAPAC